MGTPEQKYEAGKETAKADHKRGMPLEDMFKVPRPSDDENWAAGYLSQMIEIQKNILKAKAPEEDKVILEGDLVGMVYAAKWLVYKLGEKAEDWQDYGFVTDCSVYQLEWIDAEVYDQLENVKAFLKI